MIRQEIRIEVYKWRVVVFYAVTRYDVDAVMEELFTIGCSGKYARTAWENMTNGKANTGLTYTNYQQRRSVLVVGLTTSAEEFVNSFVHETHHLVAHIGKAAGLDPMSEDVCYLHGEIAREMFGVCHSLMCDDCRDSSHYTDV